MSWIASVRPSYVVAGGGLGAEGQDPEDAVAASTALAVPMVVRLMLVGCTDAGRHDERSAGEDRRQRGDAPQPPRAASHAPLRLRLGGRLVAVVERDVVAEEDQVPSSSASSMKRPSSDQRSRGAVLHRRVEGEVHGGRRRRARRPPGQERELGVEVGGPYGGRVARRGRGEVVDVARSPARGPAGEGARRPGRTPGGGSRRGRRPPRSRRGRRRRRPRPRSRVCWSSRSAPVTVCTRSAADSAVGVGSVVGRAARRATGERDAARATAAPTRAVHPRGVEGAHGDHHGRRSVTLSQLAGTVLTVGRSKSSTLSRAGCRVPTGPRANSVTRLPVTVRVKPA